MGEGYVIESGTHDELLAMNGGYSRLVQAQKLREGKTEQYSLDESQEASEEPVDMEKAAREEIPLGRRSTRQSLASEILEQRRKTEVGEKHDNDDLALPYIFTRMGGLIRDQWKNYILGCCFAASEFHNTVRSIRGAKRFFSVTGMVYPAFGIVFAKGLEGFAQVDPQTRRHDGDRNALWLFIIAIVSTLAIGFQNYLFGYAASVLTARLRTLSFRALLRQDIEFFDQEKNNVSNSLFLLNHQVSMNWCRL
jgi:ATP-binding cassette subfamily B (MDR/TAP) protein 1